MAQEQIQKKRSERTTDAVTEVKEPTKAEKTEKLKADVDSLLDEIDEILNEESLDMVNNYIQKGGQ